MQFFHRLTISHSVDFDLHRLMLSVSDMVESLSIFVFLQELCKDSKSEGGLQQTVLCNICFQSAT